MLEAYRRILPVHLVAAFQTLRPDILMHEVSLLQTAASSCLGKRELRGAESFATSSSSKALACQLDDIVNLDLVESAEN